MTVSFERNDLGPRSDMDRRSLFDPANQVSPHATRETVGADELVTLPTRPRKTHRGLTSRVCTSADDDLIVVGQLRFFHGRRVVVDADTCELTEIRERRPTIPGSCGNDHRASRNYRAVLESHS